MFNFSKMHTPESQIKVYSLIGDITIHKIFTNYREVLHSISIHQFNFRFILNYNEFKSLHYL